MWSIQTFLLCHIEVSEQDECEWISEDTKRPDQISD